MDVEPATRDKRCIQLLSDIMGKDYENMKREDEDRSSWQKRLS